MGIIMERFTLANNKVIEVIKGDITRVNYEAIVNPANSYLVMGGGVAGAIKRAGGKEIENEARRFAPIPVGEAVITGAGKLLAKYVIHAPTMERPAMRTTLEKVRLATRAALKKAEERGIKEIAFPGMGTGVGGVSPYDAAIVMVKEITDFLSHSKSITKAGLVAYDDVLYDAFIKALKKYL